MNNLPDCMYEYRYERKEPRIVDTCLDCGEFIYEGDTCYDIHGMVICETCMSGYKKEALIDD